MLLNLLAVIGAALWRVLLSRGTFGVELLILFCKRFRSCTSRESDVLRAARAAGLVEESAEGLDTLLSCSCFCFGSGTDSRAVFFVSFGFGGFGFLSTPSRQQKCLQTFLSLHV